MRSQVLIRRLCEARRHSANKDIWSAPHQMHVIARHTRELASACQNPTSTRSLLPRHCYCSAPALHNARKLRVVHRAGVAPRCITSRRATPTAETYVRVLAQSSGSVHNFFSMSSNSAPLCAARHSARTRRAVGARRQTYPLHSRRSLGVGTPRLQHCSLLRSSPLQQNSLPSVASPQVNSATKFRADFRLNRLSRSSAGLYWLHTVQQLTKILVVCSMRIRKHLRVFWCAAINGERKRKGVLQATASSRTAAVVFQVQVAR